MSRTTVAMTTALLGMVLLTGCQEKVTVVTSAWPVARVERIAPKPPVAPRWPYTGLPANSANAVKRRPLSVKIENSSAARPQIGINSADIVYETITEGGITRFNCLFHSKVPKTLGPVRSARLSDLWIVPQLKGLFFYSGASATVNRAVNNAGLPNLSQDRGVSYPYWRSSERSAPHNLMLDTKKAYEEAKKRGHKTTASIASLDFLRRSAPSTVTISEIAIPFSQANRVEWRYDAKTDVYRRWNNGAIHKDQVTGKQIVSENVVVLWAKYTEASQDMVGSVTYDVKLGGTGRASVFRNGQRFDGSWKADRTTPPHFEASDGTVIKLAPGRTWFQVIPLDGRITMK